MSVIADNLVVSRSTVINDLSKIKAYIGQGNLKVLSHPNKGLRVEGKESDKRLFLMNIKGNGVEKRTKRYCRKYCIKATESQNRQLAENQRDIVRSSVSGSESFAGRFFREDRIIFRNYDSS